MNARVWPRSSKRAAGGVRGELPFVLLVLAVGLLAAWRVGGPGLFDSADGELHLFRAFMLDRALAQGIPFPRVMPELLFGYGYPLFNFYPPAASYLVVLLHRVGLDFVTALCWAYGAALVVAALASYAYARAIFRPLPSSEGIVGGDRWSREAVTIPRAAAMVGAAAYVLAPYFLINLYTRGALGEVWAMALFPALLLAGHRVGTRGSRGDLLAVALLVALLALLHSPLALFYLPVAAGAALVPAVQTRRAIWPVVRGLSFSLPLGLALSAFSWLPAVLERDLVSVERLSQGFYDLHRNFVSVADLIARAPFYPTTSPLPIPPRLGLLQVALALGALLTLLWTARQRAPNTQSGLSADRHSERGEAAVLPDLSFPKESARGRVLRILRLRCAPAQNDRGGGISLVFLRPSEKAEESVLCYGVVYWSAIAVVALFLVTPASGAVWDSIPFIGALSFPWRLLGMVAMATALLAASLVQRLRPRLALPVALLVTAALVLLGLPGIDPPRRNLAANDLSLERYWRFEFETSMVGTTSANEYLPRALLAGSYALPRVPDDRYGAPPAGSAVNTAEVRLLDAGAQSFRLRVVAAAPTSILAHAVDFPGWRATVDGIAVATYPSTPLGLVTVPVPAGEHEVALWYGPSGPAAAGNLVSLAAALLLLLLASRAIRPRPALVVLALAVLAVALVALFRPFAPDSQHPMRQPTANEGAFSADLELIGWRQPAVHPGALAFDLYWLAHRVSQRNEVVSVALRDPLGVGRAQWEHQPQFGYSPTMRWEPGEIVPDPYVLPLSPDLPAGDYTIEVGLRGLPHAVAIGTVRLAGNAVSAGGSGTGEETSMPRHVLSLRAGEGMGLLGYDLAGPGGQPLESVHPGEALAVTLHWRAAAVLDRDYTVFLHLLDDKGERRAQHDAQPQDGRRPTMLWTPGEVVLDRHVLTLPPDLPPGRYQLLLGVYFRPTMVRLGLFSESGQRLGDATVVGTVEVMLGPSV